MLVLPLLVPQRWGGRTEGVGRERRGGVGGVSKQTPLLVPFLSVCVQELLTDGRRRRGA